MGPAGGQASSQASYYSNVDNLSNKFGEVTDLYINVKSLVKEPDIIMLTEMLQKKKKSDFL